MHVRVWFCPSCINTIRCCSRTAESVFAAAQALGPVQALSPGEDYPDSGLGIALADAARLIKSAPA